MSELKLKEDSGAAGAERRRSRRMAVLDTFNLFAVVPAKAPLKLKVHDISDMGIGFDFDIEEEKGNPMLAVKAGDMLEIQLYLNQSLFLPLMAEVRRVIEKDGVRTVGGEFRCAGTRGHTALLAYLDMLDAVSEVIDIKS